MIFDMAQFSIRDAFKIKYLYHPLSVIQNPSYHLDAILWLPSSVMSFFLELWVRNFLSGTGSSTRHLLSEL